MVTIQMGVISWLDAYPFRFSICPEKCKQIIDFQRQGLFRSLHLTVAAQNYQCALFCDLKRKQKQDSGFNYDNDNAKINVKKCKECRVMSCQ